MLFSEQQKNTFSSLEGEDCSWTFASSVPGSSPQTCCSSNNAVENGLPCEKKSTGWLRLADAKTVWNRLLHTKFHRAQSFVAFAQTIWDIFVWADSRFERLETTEVYGILYEANVFSRFLSQIRRLPTVCQSSVCSIDIFTQGLLNLRVISGSSLLIFLLTTSGQTFCEDFRLTLK